MQQHSNDLDLTAEVIEGHVVTCSNQLGHRGQRLTGQRSFECHASKTYQAKDVSRWNKGHKGHVSRSFECHACKSCTFDMCELLRSSDNRLFHFHHLSMQHYICPATTTSTASWQYYICHQRILDFSLGLYWIPANFQHIRLYSTE